MRKEDLKLNDIVFLDITKKDNVIYFKNQLGSVGYGKYKKDPFVVTGFNNGAVHISPKNARTISISSYPKRLTKQKGKVEQYNPVIKKINYIYHKQRLQGICV